MFDLIKRLTEMSGPVGEEHAVVDAVAREWQHRGVDVERSPTGNLLGRAGGHGPRLLIVAHADELCYLVRAIDERGFLWLAGGQRWARTAGHRQSFAVGQRVRILAPDQEIPGTIAAPTGHLAALALPEPREWTWNDFYVDCGLTRDELVERGVTPGTRVIWDATTERIGAHIVGKALDDRVLLAVQIALLDRIDPEQLTVELLLGCTVQEEIGLIGAAGLARTHAFDQAIALEVGLAADFPGVRDDMVPLKLGAGPVLVHKDAGVHYHVPLTRALARTAAAHGIPFQHAVFGSFASDGAALMRADVPTALLAFPVRYTHTPFETGHPDDIEGLVDWLAAYVQRPADDRA